MRNTYVILRGTGTIGSCKEHQVSGQVACSATTGYNASSAFNTYLASLGGSSWLTETNTSQNIIHSSVTVVLIHYYQHGVAYTVSTSSANYKSGVTTAADSSGHISAPIVEGSNTTAV